MTRLLTPAPTAVIARRLSPLLACMFLSTLAACATTKLPESTSSMAEIYDGVDRSAARPLALSAERPLSGGGADLSNYTRSAATELTTRFPRVPNPTLVMFVFPHIVGGDMPVPGYVTTFPLWDNAPYALPGETPEASEPIAP